MTVSPPGRSSPAEFRSTLAAQGLPGNVVCLLDYLFRTVLDGRNASVTDGVYRALGRQPRDFADFARITAATGVWNASSATADVDFAAPGSTRG